MPDSSHRRSRYWASRGYWLELRMVLSDGRVAGPLVRDARVAPSAWNME
jgi:hypothetical protein